MGFHVCFHEKDVLDKMLTGKGNTFSSKRFLHEGDRFASACVYELSTFPFVWSYNLAVNCIGESNI